MQEQVTLLTSTWDKTVTKLLDYECVCVYVCVGEGGLHALKQQRLDNV